MGGPGEHLIAVIPDGQVAIALPSSKVENSSALELGQVGDIFDILLNMCLDPTVYGQDATGNCEETSVVIIPESRIIAIGEPVHDNIILPGTDSDDPFVITFAMQPQDAIILQHLVESEVQLHFERSSGEASSAEGEQVQIVISVQSIASGETITAEALATITIPLADAPFDAIGSLEDLIGRPALTYIDPGQLIVGSMIIEGSGRFGRPSDRLNDRLPEGMVGITVPLDGLSPELETVEITSRVDILTSVCPEAIEQGLMDAEPCDVDEAVSFQDVQVIDFETGKFMVLAVSQDEVTKLVWLIDAGAALTFRLSEE